MIIHRYIYKFYQSLKKRTKFIWNIDGFTEVKKGDIGVITSDSPWLCKDSDVVTLIEFGITISAGTTPCIAAYTDNSWKLCNDNLIKLL